MIPQTIVLFPKPVTLNLQIRTGPRPRVVSDGSPVAADGPPSIPREFEELPLYVHFDAYQRKIFGHLAPIPAPLELYGSDDFTAAASDTMEDHAARVLQILEADPAGILQALIDGDELPNLPTRIPREIANWRAKAVLGTMGLTDAVEKVIAALPEPQRTIVRAAWSGDAKLARRGVTVSALGPALGLSPDQIDRLFIEAESLAI